MSAQYTQMLGAPGQAYYVNNTTYQAAASTGLIKSVALTDILGLLEAGCTWAIQRCLHVNFGAVATAATAALITNVALAAGVLVIAHQPDVPRQGQFVVAPGAAAITAGTNTVVYQDETNTTRTDVFSLVTISGLSLTQTTSYGISSLTSATIAGVVGGSSPTIQLGTNTVLALPTDQSATGLTVVSATVDGSSDTLPTFPSTVDLNLITPHTAPNATHIFQFLYSFYTP